MARFDHPTDHRRGSAGSSPREASKRLPRAPTGSGAAAFFSGAGSSISRDGTTRARASPRSWPLGAIPRVRHGRLATWRREESVGIPAGESIGRTGGGGGSKEGNMGAGDGQKCKGTRSLSPGRAKDRCHGPRRASRRGPWWAGVSRVAPLEGRQSPAGALSTVARSATADRGPWQRPWAPLGPANTRRWPSIGQLALPVVSWMAKRSQASILPLSRRGMSAHRPRCARACGFQAQFVVRASRLSYGRRSHQKRRSPLAPIPLYR